MQHSWSIQKTTHPLGRVGDAREIAELIYFSLLTGRPGLQAALIR